MKVTFVTAQELEPLTALAMNLRFYGFLIVLAKELHLDEAAVVAAARRIMENADIKQED
ncbi:MAG: hypothetical protein IJP49_06310 [Bacteroidales bacterium]|nr:hypothetical protein [Bacteroidales bacterium]